VGRARCSCRSLRRFCEPAIAHAVRLRGGTQRSAKSPRKSCQPRCCRWALRRQAAPAVLPKGLRRIKAQAGHSRLSALALSDRPAEKGSRLLWLTSNNGRDSSLDPIDTRVATTSNYKRALSLKRGSGDGGLESPRLCYRD
jgi:hypothetical protein